MLSSLLVMALFTGCTSSKEEEKSPEDTQESTEDSAQKITANLIQFEDVKEGMPVVKMTTNLGDVEMMLFPEQAPLAVKNFLELADRGYYNGVIFHRVIDGFMIQGGDPTETGAGGESIYTTEDGKPAMFPDEFSNDLYQFNGALAMANAGANTNTSQFFIVQSKEIFGGITKEDLLKAGWPENVVEKYTEVGGTPHLDRKHTVFGQVISGMEVVDAIAKTETDEQDKPVEDVVISSIEVSYPAGGEPTEETNAQ